MAAAVSPAYCCAMINELQSTDESACVRARVRTLSPRRMLAGASILMLQFCLAADASAQEVKPAPESQLASSDSDSRPVAVTISIRGDCDYSEDGVTFTKLERAHIFEQGAIVRTGEAARADLFFRRTGTTVRLQAGTEIKLEKMTVTVKDGAPIVRTLLDLRKGRICAVVRSEVAG